jgi:lipase ATG15
MICTITSLSLIYIIYLKKDEDADDPSDLKKFERIRPSNEDSGKDKSAILPSICSASLYNIPIISYIPFINDAYYYTNNRSSLDYSNYTSIFFNNSDYKITPKRNMIKNGTKEKKVKMIQYDLESPNNNVTILSIKGTSYNKDIYLDIQLYTPSVLLNLLLNFSIFLKLKETRSFHFLEYGLTMPYRMFFMNLIVKDYIDVLKKAYNNSSKEFEKNNVVIVGHSLGGGLSKILGKMVKKPSISLSGPGANAFHSLWGEEGISDNFDITTIDLVPDMDLVPRVEVSGGTIYRIICREGPLGCHSKDLSLCEVLIMCQKNYQIVCDDIAELKGKDIDRIKEASKLIK